MPIFSVTKRSENSHRSTFSTPAKKRSQKSVTLDQLNYPSLDASNLIWKPNVICFSSRWSFAKCLYHPSAVHLCLISACALVRQVICRVYNNRLQCVSMHWNLSHISDMISNNLPVLELTRKHWNSTVIWIPSQLAGLILWWPDFVRHLLCLSINKGLSSMWHLWCCDIQPDL